MFLNWKCHNLHQNFKCRKRVAVTEKSVAAFFMSNFQLHLAKFSLECEESDYI